jgi:IS5 family transposase
MPDIPFSHKYRHDVKALYRDFAEQRITEEELSQRLDELRVSEAAAQESLGQHLLLEKLVEEEKSIADDVQRELLREKQQRELEEQDREMERQQEERNKFLSED